MSPSPEHGTYARYQVEAKARRKGEGEVCDQCHMAETAYQRSRFRAMAYGRPLRQPVLGSRRRLQALLALGWSGQHLADQLGRQRSNLPLARRYTTIKTVFHEDIVTLYQRLRYTAGPNTDTANRADKLGYSPPELWGNQDLDDPASVPVCQMLPELDQVAIDLVVLGKPAFLTRQDKAELVRQQLRLGVPQYKIGSMLKMSHTTYSEFERWATDERTTP